MRGKVTATLVSNAGILLKYDNTAILIDGIYRDKLRQFSAMNGEVWKMMMNGEDPFGHIDYLFFTHAHRDHFSRERVREYLEKWEVKGIYLPDTGEIYEDGLLSFIREKGIPVEVIPADTISATYSLEGDTTVSAFGTFHLNKKYHDVVHFCYLVTIGGRSILFTSDVDYIDEDLSFTDGISLKAAFVNPLFIGELELGRSFRGSLDVEEYCVYHVPFEEDDVIGIRSKLKRTAARWGSDLPRLSVLQDPLQSIDL